jgi:hypothetical protein
MSHIPVRRAQLIAPFGVGAMMTGQDGTSMITAALDAWFDPNTAGVGTFDPAEFTVEEWRLQEALRVSGFRLPPDYRSYNGHGGDGPTNMGIKVPLLRFPLWHFCRRCRLLAPASAHTDNRIPCAPCSAKAAAAGKSWKTFMAQVPFVAMCDEGHIQDFPWREWVHRSVAPRCDQPLSLRALGMASLAAQKVQCACGAERTLSGITQAFQTNEGEDTNLTALLAPGARFECRGMRPWMADQHGEGCGRPLRGSLRAATNVYFAHVESAIYLPPRTVNAPDRLIELLESPPLSEAVKLIQQMKMDVVSGLQQSDYWYLLAPYPLEQIAEVLESLAEGKEAAKAAAPVSDEVDPALLRRPEHQVLLAGLETKDLMVRTQEPASYGELVNSRFQAVNLVDRLRETRALYGFSRINSDGRRTLVDRKRMLWRNEPVYAASWLPAYTVSGEGLFFEFSADRLAAWERRPDVVERVAHLAHHAQRMRVNPALADPALVPRFVLVHTFAHLMINQLVFECGYSSASLSERLYCAVGDSPMAGVLIYTAAGDSEGTMGGLVRMGRPGSLDPVITAALDKAAWCSSDPVCMELSRTGQGPGGKNLAACHSCGLLPETACECFNQFLDRGVVVGTHDAPSLGYFG